MKDIFQKSVCLNVKRHERSEEKTQLIFALDLFDSSGTDLGDGEKVSFSVVSFRWKFFFEGKFFLKKAEVSYQN